MWSSTIVARVTSAWSNWLAALRRPPHPRKTTTKCSTVACRCSMHCVLWRTNWRMSRPFSRSFSWPIANDRSCRKCWAQVWRADRALTDHCWTTTTAGTEKSIAVSTTLHPDWWFSATGVAKFRKTQNPISNHFEIHYPLLSRCGTRLRRNFLSSPQKSRLLHCGPIEEPDRWLSASRSDSTTKKRQYDQPIGRHRQRFGSGEESISVVESFDLKHHRLAVWTERSGQTTKTKNTNALNIFRF